jgi:hypothetical protein
MPRYRTSEDDTKEPEEDARSVAEVPHSPITYTPSEATTNELTRIIFQNDIQSSNILVEPVMNSAFYQQIQKASTLDLSYLLNVPETTVLLMVQIAASASPIDKINLMHTEISSVIVAIAQAIAQSTKIHTVNIGGCHVMHDMNNTSLAEDTFRALATSSTIRTLVLGKFCLTKQATIIAVAKILATFPKLDTLDLSWAVLNNSLSEDVARALATSPTLRHLIISNNSLSAPDLIALALAKAPNLQILEMACCGIGDPLGFDTAHNLTLSSSLRSVDMTFNSFNHSVAKIFAEHAARYFDALLAAYLMDEILPIPRELIDIIGQYLAPFPINYNIHYEYGFGDPTTDYRPHGADNIPFSANFDAFLPRGGSWRFPPEPHAGNQNPAAATPADGTSSDSTEASEVKSPDEEDDRGNAWVEEFSAPLATQEPDGNSSSDFAAQEGFNVPNSQAGQELPANQPEPSPEDTIFPVFDVLGAGVNITGEVFDFGK